MKKIEKLRELVKDAYGQHLPTAADWAGWLYDKHVLIVADYAVALAVKHGANAELAEAAALLHDVADHIMKRSDPCHEEESLRLAREFMTQAGYFDDEINLVVDDAIKFHSCHGNERPRSKEGMVLAAADAFAHLKTNYYYIAVWSYGKEGRSLQDFREWALKKLDRDLYDRISFDDEREATRPDYDKLKELISSI